MPHPYVLSAAEAKTHEKAQTIARDVAAPNAVDVDVEARFPCLRMARGC